MSYENPWTYRGALFDTEHIEGYIAFVYLIENTVNGKRYVGKKMLESRRTKVVKGKRKKTTTESDWKRYYGSSADLLADVEKYGKENFKREILHLCRNKGSANYLEAKEIFVREALERDDFYNNWCDVKVSRSHVKL